MATAVQAGAKAYRFTLPMRFLFTKEIKEKHLTLFIPYSILRLRSRIKVGNKQPLTSKELTEFVKEAILILKDELSDGYLTELEYRDYVRLFHFAADRVLHQHPQLQEEVHRMTEPLIKLPSVIIKELQAEIAGQKAEIADQKAKIASKDAEILRLQQLVSELSES